MSTRMHTRVFALIGALLFLFTSCALTAAVVWQIHKDNNANKSIGQGKTSQDTSKSTIKTAEANKAGTQGSTNTQGANKLEGTILANFTPVEKIDALQSTDLKDGDGDEVKTGDSITVHYTGAIASSGKIFESSHDGNKPASFPLSGVIQGWQQGVPGMKVGGTRRLLIPASLAYGNQASSKIPANSDLVFDIELISIDK